jgi:DNA-directed RNA polymerase specialized sigma24 family protein
MASEPPGSAAGTPPAAARVPIQPEVGSQPAVPESWLRLLDPETLSLAENVDRLAGDADLVMALELGGYTGHDWNVFSRELAKYGIGVLTGWMYRGLILARCKERGYGGLAPLGRPFEPDEIAELAGETVAKALHHFKLDVLIPHKWDPNRRATLRTFFIGQCLLRFANIYRRWWGQEYRNRSVLVDESAVLDAFAPTVAADDQRALDSVIAMRALRSIRDRRVHHAMFRHADGRTYAEIAIELEVTEKTVERMIAHARNRLRKRTAG